MRKLRTLMAGDAESAIVAESRAGCGSGATSSTQLVKIAKRPSMTTISTMLDTTALVVDRPTEVAPAPVARPRSHPISAIVKPNTAAFAMPSTKSPDHHQRSAEHAHHVGQDREQRHHHRRRDQARDDQELHRAQPERRDRVDLLVDLLRADLRRECGPGASGEHDRGHQGAELAQHRDPDSVHHEEHGAELPRDERDLERDDDAHEEADQENDRYCVRAGLGRDVQHLSPTHRARSPECMRGRGHAFGQKSGHLLGAVDLLDGRLTQVLEDARSGPDLRRLGEVLRLVASNQSGEVRG
jgi:hypothetical protein